MKTSEFVYRQFPFEEFNKAQILAVKSADQDANLVISMPTASGKTAIIEAIFGFHTETDNTKLLYICPFKSLAEEKYEDWSTDEQFIKNKPVIICGDREFDKDKFFKSRMAIMTTESFDAKTRNYPEWFKNVGALVIDEAHSLSTKKRGAALESAIIRSSILSPVARLILVSAEIGNHIEIAKWLKNLNGKTTKSINSSWRPNYISYDFEPIPSGYYDIFKLVLEKIKETPKNKKIIVFVHSKKMGKYINDELKRKKIKSLFHNGSLSGKERKKIESLFSSCDSNMNVIISTSTLSTGVNLK